MCFFKKNILMTTGAIESPEDRRDIMLASIQSKIELRKLPEEYIIPFKLRISAQGSKPHCVGYASATMKEDRERREQHAINFDGDWIYNECKKIDGYSGKGTYLRTALKILKNKGAKQLGVNSDCRIFRIGTYVRVGRDVESIKNAIYQNGTLIALYRGSNSGWKTAHIKPTTADWGHCISIIGWNKDDLIFQNSWGESWGDNGLGYIPENYHSIEIWTILNDLPNDFEIIGKPKYEFLNNLSIGDRNDEVKKLQECLKSEGVFPEIIDCTGYFGTITLSSVKNFQVKYGIINTGYVGILTRTKLNELFS